MRSILLGLLLVLVVSTGTTKAQVLKIGYVDPQEILVKMPEYAAVERRLQNFAERKRDEFSKLQADFEKRANDFQQKASVLSNDARTTEERALEAMRERLVNFQTQYQEDLMKEQQTQLTPLFAKIEKGIADVATEMGMTFILNPRTSNGDIILLYVSDQAKETLNITRAVIAKLDL
jgi:outer membrane protein